MDNTYLEQLPKEILYEILLNLDISDINFSFPAELTLDSNLLRKVIHRDFSDKINTLFIDLDVIRNLDIKSYNEFKRFYSMKTYHPVPSITFVLFSGLDLDLSYKNIIEAEKLGLDESVVEIFNHYVIEKSNVYLFRINKKDTSHIEVDEDMKELKIYTTIRVMHNLIFYFQLFTIFHMKKY